MCANCRNALEQRTEAVARLMEACSETHGITRGLKLVYPVRPVPDDLMALAMRIGGRG